jgi:hypothetical protein
MKLGKLLELIDLAKSGKKIVRCTERTVYGSCDTFGSYKFEEIDLLNMELEDLKVMEDNTHKEQVSEGHFKRLGEKLVYTYGTYDEMKPQADCYGEKIILLR